MMKINNDEEWKAVQDGEYKGFSIEGLFDGFDQLKFQEQKPTEEDIINQFIKILENANN